jgi:uncharacterized protein with HEPN domain
LKSHQIIATHILGAIDRIEQYTDGLSERQFLDNFFDSRWRDEKY